MTVEVHRVPHHGAVVEDDLYVFAFPDEDPVGFRDSFVVDGPDVAIHIACQVEAQNLFRACGQGGGGRGAQHAVMERYRGAAVDFGVHDGIHVHRLIAHLHAHVPHIAIHLHHAIHHFHAFEIFQWGEDGGVYFWSVAQ